MGEAIPAIKTTQFNCKILSTDGGPGSAKQLAAYVNSCNLWQNLPGTDSRQRMQRLQGMLGSHG
tara:strand:+ start:252 stop:443 length:192 start_codon:yes stop_codon:yes gene_type:complete